MKMGQSFACGLGADPEVWAPKMSRQKPEFWPWHTGLIFVLFKD
jgi:hypothetical protein